MACDSIHRVQLRARPTAAADLHVVRGAGERERQKRMLRPNPTHEAKVCGSRGAGAQLDTVD